MKKGFGLWNAMGKELGIDLGTANTVIYEKGRGIILREPSLVAVDQRSDEILAAGKEARDMLGKNTAGIRLVRPIQNGVVADFDGAAAMLRIFIKRAIGTGPMNRPRLIISVPAGSTEVEKTAAQEVARQAGGVDVQLLEAPLGVLLGAGISPVGAKAVLTLNMGAGHTEAAVSLLGQVVACAMARSGGMEMDQAITRHIRRKYGLQLGEAAAQELKEKLGSAFPTEEGYGSFMEVKGRSVTDNLPKNITVHGDEIRPVVVDTLNSAVVAVMRVCEALPAQIAADVLESGILLTGGGAALAGLVPFLTQALGLNLIIGERPLDLLAEGLGRSLGVQTETGPRTVPDPPKRAKKPHGAPAPKRTTATNRRPVGKRGRED